MRTRRIMLILLVIVLVVAIFAGTVFAAGSWLRAKKTPKKQVTCGACGTQVPNGHYYYFRGKVLICQKCAWELAQWVMRGPTRTADPRWKSF